MEQINLKKQEIPNLKNCKKRVKNIVSIQF